VRESETGLLPVMGGRYKDAFVKVAGDWRFARKEFEHHIWGDMALKNGRCPLAFIAMGSGRKQT